MWKYKKKIILTLIFATGAVGIFSFSALYKKTGSTFVVESDTSVMPAQAVGSETANKYPPNTMSGVACKNHGRRPVAVTLAEDYEARPLSGIGAADLVVEMPVVFSSITRMMAVFVCGDPTEIGSVRSARQDFIPLAAGYDAILAHWGGEKQALEKLNNGIIDNLDALPNYFGTFFRKKWIPAPHNGFTNMANILNAAEKLGYRNTSKFEGYKFIENPKSETLNPKQAKNSKSKTQKLFIGYAYPYNVRYEYDPKTNSYSRWRAGLKEIDKLTGEQVAVKNIAVMRTFSRPISKDYNDVDVVGSGDAMVYRGGEEVVGSWRKKSDKDVLRFFDETGEEVRFMPGSIWVEIVELDTRVVYE